jgi:hypothetical protein
MSARMAGLDERCGMEGKYRKRRGRYVAADKSDALMAGLGSGSGLFVPSSSIHHPGGEWHVDHSQPSNSSCLANSSLWLHAPTDSLTGQIPSARHWAAHHSD